MKGGLRLAIIQLPQRAGLGFELTGRAQAAYFSMINETGGADGRKIDPISLDGGRSATRSLEQTRRMVAPEQVVFIFRPTWRSGPLDDNRAGQLLVAIMCGDPRLHLWTMSFVPNHGLAGALADRMPVRPGARAGIAPDSRLE